MSENINVVLATDNNYAQHATVVMASVMANSSNSEAITFYVINDNISEEHQQKMVETINYFGGQLNFIEANADLLKNVFISGSLTRATYFRLDIANILPETVRKVIYLDCDLLVLQDISDLWNFDMRGKPLAATEDFGILSSKGKCREKENSL